MPSEIIPDGNVDFSAGQDSSRSADKLQPNGYYAGINVTSKNGSLSPRWGYEQLTLEFPIGGIDNRDWKTIFETGKFQAFIPYIVGSDEYIITIINGIIFLVNVSTLKVKIITLDGEQLASNTHRHNWSPANLAVDIFDFPNYPVIIEDLEARRADPEQLEIPVARLGAYNSSRLFIANNGAEFTAGDPVSSRTTGPNTFQEILVEGSNYLGQVFKLTTNYQNQPITAMAFLQTTDTSTGVGPLLVATKKIIESYNAQTPRETWESQQFGSVFVYNAGIANQRAQCNINSDLFFMSADGRVRSLSMSRDEQKRYSKTSLSNEVAKWLKFGDIELTEFAAMEYFENKLFITANPFRTTALSNKGEPVTDFAHGGTVVLEFDNITSLGETGRPAWAGLWTGVRPMDFAKVGEKMFVISKDRDPVNRIYRVRNDLTYDLIDNKPKFIKSRIYTREYNFQNPLLDKKLVSLGLGIEEVAGPLNIDISYKSGHSSYYTYWNNFKHNVDWRACNPSKVSGSGFSKQGFKEVSFGAPDDEFDEFTKESLTSFRRIGFKIDISAKYWELHTVKASAMVLPPVTNINRPESSSTSAVAQCDNDWSVLHEEICR